MCGHWPASNGDLPHFRTNTGDPSSFFMVRGLVSVVQLISPSAYLPVCLPAYCSTTIAA